MTNQFVTQVTNLTETENGALSYKSSLNHNLDLFSMAVTSSDLRGFIIRALDENPKLAVKVCLHLRDVRNGQGNRDLMRTFHSIMRDWRVIKRELFSKYLEIIKYFPEVGCWKDLYEQYGRSQELDLELLEVITEGLQNVEAAGLAAKWFPINRKCPSGANLHKDLAKHWDVSLGTLRKIIVALRTTVEQSMCSKQWSTINYSHVPSKANRKYAEAFLRNDEERRSKFLKDATEGKVKMNSSVLYPHEIVNLIGSSYETADALWANLPDYMENSETFNILPVIDTSGSMSSSIGGSDNIRCLDVAIGLGLYFSGHNRGDYKDLWCNFSETPNFYKLNGATLSERVRNLDYHNWDSSTNLEAVFDLILTTYQRTLNKEELPKVVLIVSDMEFNSCGGSKTNYESIKQKYQELGLEVPIIVFWRVDTKSNQQPVTMLDNGTVLVNGFSPSFIKLLLKMDLESLREMTPLNIMLQTVEPLYPFVDSIFKDD